MCSSNDIEVIRTSIQVVSRSNTNSSQKPDNVDQASSIHHDIILIRKIREVRVMIILPTRDQ